MSSHQIIDPSPQGLTNWMRAPPPQDITHIGIDSSPEGLTQEMRDPLTGPSKPNNRFLIRGPNMPDEDPSPDGSTYRTNRTLTRWSDAPDWRSPTRWSDTPDNRSLTRGSVNSNCLPWEVKNRGHQVPTLRDTTVLPSATLNFQQKGGKIIYNCELSVLFPLFNQNFRFRIKTQKQSTLTKILNYIGNQARLSY